MYHEICKCHQRQQRPEHKSRCACTLESAFLAACGLLGSGTHSDHVFWHLSPGVAAALAKASVDSWSAASLASLIPGQESSLSCILGWLLLDSCAARCMGLQLDPIQLKIFPHGRGCPWKGQQPCCRKRRYENLFCWDVQVIVTAGCLKAIFHNLRGIL